MSPHFWAAPAAFVQVEISMEREGGLMLIRNLFLKLFLDTFHLEASIDPSTHTLWSLARLRVQARQDFCFSGTNPILFPLTFFLPLKIEPHDHQS